MTENEAKEITHRLLRAFETNDQAAMKAVLAPNLQAYHFGASEPLGRDQLLAAIADSHAAFSDQKYTILDQVAAGDREISRTIWEATHTGPYQGLTPTGRRIRVSGIAISRFQDGRVVERWLEFDRLGWLQQLGLVPPPRPASEKDG